MFIHRLIEFSDNANPLQEKPAHTPITILLAVFCLQLIFQVTPKYVNIT